MDCTFCKEISTSSIQIRTGEHHEAQDQRDSSRIVVVGLCRLHQIEFFNWIADMSLNRKRVASERG
jgi:hypothetical protein